MMACEYCQGTKNLISEFNADVFINGGYLQADVLYDDEECLFESHVKRIRFCPMCKERLGDTNE